MLLGKNRRKPDLAAIRRIKQVLHDALDLTDKATVTLTELACFEDCLLYTSPSPRDRG